MRSITFTFDVIEEDASLIVEVVKEMKSFWESQGFQVSLHQDVTRRTRFVQTFMTEKTVDDLTSLIQKDAKVQAIFERIKKSDSRVLVSVMEQIV